MKRSFLLFLVIFIIIGVQAYSQSLKFGAGGGLTMVMSPDSYTNDIAEEGLGFGAEYHFGVKAKLSLPMVPIIPIGYINYHLLASEGESFTGPKDITQNLLTVGLGIEYSFLTGPLSPYAGLDLQFNSFGDLEGLTNPIPGEARTGLGIGAGLEFSLVPSLNVDVNAKYNMLNLMGKEEGEESLSTVTLTAILLFGGI
jgi:opacity protein-like surface antigen